MNSAIDLSGLSSFNLEDMKREIELEEIRRSHLRFMQYTWTKNNSPMVVGFHTKMICDRIDKAIEDFRAGKSTYLVIKVPFRHGKSDMLSRWLPPRFLGEFPECEVMTTGFGQDLINKFSRDSRNILKSKKYKEIYPNIFPSRVAFNVKEWNIDNEIGKTLWVGFGGAMTGSGFHLGLVDDPFKNRQEAESEAIREARWRSFTNDFLSRKAPVHIVIVLATPWHTDDLFGRIETEMKANPEFPRFEEMCFPAKAKDYQGEGEYTSEWLFSERFPGSWYTGHYATLGPYDSSGLLDCNPKSLDGLLIKCKEGVNYHFVDEKPEGFGPLGRAWDLASSEEETQKKDPDWTVGVRGAIRIEEIELYNEYKVKIKVPVYHIYIDDVVGLRKEAIERDRVMQMTAVRDKGIIQGIEAFAGYKDTYTAMSEILNGVCQVERINLKGDKVTKATQHIVNPFAAGNVYVNRNIEPDMLEELLKQLESFPNGAHDDFVDATVIMTAMMKEYGFSTFDTLV